MSITRRRLFKGFAALVATGVTGGLCSLLLSPELTDPPRTFKIVAQGHKLCKNHKVTGPPGELTELMPGCYLCNGATLPPYPELSEALQNCERYKGELFSNAASHSKGYTFHLPDLRGRLP